MKASDIQKILQQEREKSPLKGLTSTEINRKIGAVMAGDNKRKIPHQDKPAIIYEYWDRDTPRPLGLSETIGKRYGVKSVDVTICNRSSNNYKDCENIIPEDEYEKLVDTYNTKFGRSAMMKQVHNAGLRDNKAAGIAISLAKNGITREDAISIYDMCLQGSDTRSHMYYKLLAKQYGVSMGKIRDVANGHHPALEDKDVETDVANWKSKQLGYYVYTSPAGVEHTFKDFYELGAWLWKTEHGITDKTQHQNWCKGRMWFEGKQPNTVYVKQRRFWKGWEYVNIVE